MKLTELRDEAIRIDYDTFCSSYSEWAFDYLDKKSKKNTKNNITLKCRVAFTILFHDRKKELAKGYENNTKGADYWAYTNLVKSELNLFGYADEAMQYDFKVLLDNWERFKQNLNK